MGIWYGYCTCLINLSQFIQEWSDVFDVNSFINCSSLDTDCAICIDMSYLKRTSSRGHYLSLFSMFSISDFVIYLISVFNSFGVLHRIIVFNHCLSLGLNGLSISSHNNGKNHVSTKNQLYWVAWRTV